MRATARLLGALLVAAAVAVPAAAQAPRQTAVLAGGCFWGMQEVFEHVDGVTRVISGYSGGTAATATDEQVNTETTGHAESVEITFDPAVVSYATLLDVFFRVAHDPTQLDRQGPDAGKSYRSVIFYADAAQHREAEAAIARLTAARVYAGRIVTEVVPLHGFYRAAAYHQDYAVRHPDDPYIVDNDLPKVRRLREVFPRLYREAPVLASSR